MSSDNRVRLTPRDYAFTALMNQIAYESREFRDSVNNGNQAQVVAKAKVTESIVEAFQIFFHEGRTVNVDTEIDEFFQRFEMVSAVGADNDEGANLVVFADQSSKRLIYALAGVNTNYDLEQTISQTGEFGYNRENFAAVQTTYEALSQEYGDWFIDITGHSLGGQSAQLLASYITLKGKGDQLVGLTTFGSYHINLEGLLHDSTTAAQKELIRAVQGLGRFAHFVIDGDPIPFVTYSDPFARPKPVFTNGFQLFLEMPGGGLFSLRNTLGIIKNFGAPPKHELLAYLTALGLRRNNTDDHKFYADPFLPPELANLLPPPVSVGAEDPAHVGFADDLSLTPEEIEAFDANGDGFVSDKELGYLGAIPIVAVDDASFKLVFPDLTGAALDLDFLNQLTLVSADRDPNTRAALPTNARLKVNQFGQFAEGVFDRFDRSLELVFATNADGIPVNAAGEAILNQDGTPKQGLSDYVQVVAQTRVTDGQGSNGKGGVVVIQQIDPTSREPVSTEIEIQGNPIPFDFSDIGGALGTQLGLRIAGGDQLAGVLTSSLLQTIGDNLGDSLDGIFGNQSVERASTDAFSTFDHEFVANLKSAGVGAVSSFLTAELVNALGVEGFAGEALNTGAGFFIGQIASGLAAGDTVKDVLNGLGSAESLANLSSAAASFLGSKLGDEIYTAETIGGQIGGAVGTALAGIQSASSIATAFEIKAGVVTGNPAIIAAALAVAVLRTAAFKVIGSLIGSIFGGTPRSGADTVWDEQEGRFVVANAYSRKGGSEETAEGLAGVVAETFNTVLEATGGRLADPSAITTGNYGMRKSDFVYRPTSTRDKDAITYRVSTKNDDAAFEKVTGYGIFQGLTDPDFEIIGGSNYVKRAFYATFEMGGMSATDFDQSVLLGNIASAQSYEAYLDNSAVINAIVSGEPDSVFAAETALNLVRAQELGLHKRHRSDWFGGFNALFEEGSTNAANVDFGFDYDPFNDQVSRLIGVGEFVLGDSIDVAGQLTIERSEDEIANDTIDLRSGQLADQTGYVINGQLRDDITDGTADYSAPTGSSSIAGAALRSTATISAVANATGEASETFKVNLGDDAGTYLMRGEADVTIVDGAEDAHLMVGRAYANEGENLVWRVSLSKAAAGAVTLDLALNSDGAVAGTDYSEALEISANGTSGWTSASSLTLSTGVTEYFVRSAALTSPEVEGNERVVLSATAASGAEHLHNGDQASSGIGVIVDTPSTDPLVWADDLIIHEGSSGELSIARDRATGNSNVSLSASDNRVLDIAVAATVDAGAGDDVVYASDLGDNIFGGDGNDTLHGGRLDDWLLGGAGNDTLDAGGPAGLGGDGNYLDGGDGNDTLYGREGSDWLEGGDGDDQLWGNQGGDILTGGAGADALSGGAGDDTYLLRLGDSADIVVDSDPSDIARDLSGDLLLTSFNSDLRSEITARFDAVSLYTGSELSQFVADQYAGLNSSDWVGFYTPGVQNASVDGGEDSVVLGQGIGIGDIRLQRSGTTSAPGNDLIIKIMTLDAQGAQIESGDQLTLQNWFLNPFERIEWLKFADGNEIRIGDLTSFVSGSNGNDTLIGTLGNDFVYGGGGDDTLFLLAGNDIGNGGTGSDAVSGDSGDDLIVGGSGDDSITGEAGADTLSGDGGDDEIYGGSGNDLISGGRGNDWLAGGAGDDVFKYNRGDGQDTIIDEVSGSWSDIWTRSGGWASGYSENADGELVRNSDGAILRENVGTAEAPDLKWNGRFEFDSLGERLRYFEPSTSDAAQNAGTDTIEFDPTIHVQDLVLEASGDNLVIHVSRDNGSTGSFVGSDSVTLTDWFSGSGVDIEQLAFFSTGTLDLDATTVVAGTASGDSALNGNTATANWITGGLGDDTITGGSAADILAGNGGIDKINAGAGDDALYGGSGDDVLIGGAGADILVGGAGSDWASYENETTGFELSFSDVDSATGSAEGDSFLSVENIRGGSGDDEVGGDTGDNIIEGGAGNDTLSGGSGDDTYVWNGTGDGNDTIIEGAIQLDVAMLADGSVGPGFVGDWYDVGDTTIELIPGEPEPADIWAYQIRKTGTGLIAYSDPNTETRAVIHGKPTTPPLSINQGWWQNGFVQETQDGRASRVVIDQVLEAGEDTIELGEGIALSDLTFSRTGDDLLISANGSTVTIENQYLDGGRVEYLQFHDGLSARLDNLVLDGISGNEADFIIGHTATLAGGDGDDVIYGGTIANTIYAGAGNDVVEGGAGADNLHGQLGDDTLRYTGSGAGVVVDLAQLTVSGGDAQGDTISGFENVEGSWAHNDSLTGDANDNRIFGLGGDDLIAGAGGEDVLIGGGGNDDISGDTGEDNISGDAGDDVLSGGSDNDIIAGGEGRDRLLGDAGDDQLLGGDGDDQGTSGAITYGLYGGLGDDTLDGGAGADRLEGGDGNDTLVGGIGDDVLHGDDGDDLFVFGANDGQDSLVDSGGNDTIVFTEGVGRDQLWLFQDGNDLKIHVIGGDTEVQLTNFFTTMNSQWLVEKVQTADGTLFLNDPEVLALITDMTAHSNSTPSEIPQEMAETVARSWNDGDTSAPRAPATPQTVQITTLSANAFNNDQWPDLAPTGKAEDNLVNEEAWPRDIDALPSNGSIGADWVGSQLAETTWVATESPYATSLNTLLADQQIVALRASQDTSVGWAGGGAESSQFAIDKTKAYEYSLYFRVNEHGPQQLFAGLVGDVVDGTSGNAPAWAYFTQSQLDGSSNLDQDRWYKLVGYVLPDGSALEGADAYGGIYDTVTGEKVEETAHFNWDSSGTSNTANFRFFLLGSDSQGDQTTDFLQPEVREVVDTSYMLRNGDRLNTWQDSKFVGSTYVEGYLPVASFNDDGEARWTEAQGPDGTNTVVLETGEHDGIIFGGGHITNSVTIDRSKTYRYVQYFRKSHLGDESLSIGLITTAVGMEQVSSGLATSSGYFVSGGEGPNGWQQQLIEDEWYMAVGYVFADGDLPSGAATHGGIYRASDGVKVAGVENHQWRAGADPLQAHGLYHNLGDQTIRGWTTQFTEPSLGVIDAADIAAYETDPFGLSNTWLGEAVNIDASAGVTDFDNNITSWAINPDGAPTLGQIVSIDETTGTVVYRPYADALGSDNISVVAIDADGNQAIIPIEVELTLGNVIQAPIVPIEGYQFELAENSVQGDIAGTLTATDPGQVVEFLFDDSLMIGISGHFYTFSDDRRFKMRRDTGLVQVNEGTYDFEAGAPSFGYAVRVRNGYGSYNSRSARSSLTVSITDVNEAHTLTNASVNVFHFPTALGPLVPVPDESGFAIKLSDLMLDDPEGENLSWSLDTTGTPTPFSIGVDGVLYQTGSATWNTTYSLTVVATDGNPAHDQTAVLTIEIVGAQNTSNPEVEVTLPDFPDFEFDIEELIRGTYLPPIILDLDGDGVELLSISADVRFDMDANGTLDRTGWFGPDDAVLAFDENANGLVDDGSEINFQRFVDGAFSDLEGLAFFDTNANGLFDQNDAQWGEFLVWQDVNSDGVSQDDELRSLDQAGIVSINLTGQRTGQTPDGTGNVLFATSTYATNTGVTGEVGDVFFVFDPATADGGDPTPPIDDGDPTPPPTDADAGDPPPELVFGSLTYGIKSKNYRLTSAGGEVFIRPRGTTPVLDQRAGALGGPTYFAFKGHTFGLFNAVVLDLDGDGLEERRYKKSKVSFDMDGNGSRDRTGWVIKGDGMLVIDRNGNGRVDDASEMAFLDSDNALLTGQAGLLALDTNSDGQISADDDLFSELSVWVDANRNGVTDIGEMRLLSNHGIESISLAFASVEQSKKFGRNVTLATTVFTRTDGSTGTIGDIGLGFVPAATPTRTAVTSGPGAFDIERLLELSGVSLEDLSIEELMQSFEEGQFYRERSETYISTTGGDYPLPVLRSRLVEEWSDSDLASAADGDDRTQEPAHIAPPPAIEPTMAARIALLRQDLAAFGGKSGIDDLAEQRKHQLAPLDYFA